MKLRLLLTLSTISILAFIFLFEKKINSLQEKIFYPIPTEIGGPDSKEEKIREEAESQSKREAWFELMHGSAEGTNWKKIESQTRYTRHLERATKRSSATFRGGEDELLANDQLKGSWCERGSNNQAGRVMATAYDPDADMIWLISDGGTLFKGPKDGSAWEMVNQDLRFNGALLEFVPIGNGRRLIAFIDDLPHYSDDDGGTWIPSTGILDSGNDVSFHSPIVLSDSLNRIYVLSKDGFWSDIHLYRSDDKGETFVDIAEYDTNNFREFKLCSPHHSEDIYMLYRPNNAQVQFLQIETDTDAIDTLSTSSFFIGNGDRTNLTGTTTDTSTLFYVYDGDETVFQTEDFGQTWKEKATLPERPWNVGMYVLPSNPDWIYMGEMEMFVSGNGGVIWFKANNWWDYYDNVLHRLHADMMHFKEFQTSAGENFILVSNDGGLSIAFEDDYGDFVDGYFNIGLEGLNISQYYDVVSDPNPGNLFIYAGSQDQGLQRTFVLNSSDDEILDFEQVISGDYGHITFSKNNSRMWVVFPDGWVSYYLDPTQDGGPTFSYELESEDESVWIPPLMASPDPAEDAVFLAGGNADGGEGSYIIKLEIQNNEIVATNLPFDFKVDSFGEVSAIKTSPFNPSKWYAATTNGKFYQSEDSGQTWEAGLFDVPDAQFLYGNTIYPSKFEEDVVYIGGSGYDNQPVLKSVNGGSTFTGISNGLPPTLVYELTANADESMLFAATESGPYVYIVADEMWYDMSGVSAPAQTYWSVEYLEESNFVRFGTYGRGIWDFRITEEVDVDDLLAKNAVKIFPNPTDGLIELELNDLEGDNAVAKLFDISGKLLLEKTILLQNPSYTKEQLDLNKFSSGIYFLKIENEKGSAVEKIIRK